MQIFFKYIAIVMYVLTPHIWLALDVYVYIPKKVYRNPIHACQWGY